ncbi:replication protein A 70 kDa DNA-binding subunit A-like protein, partial [Tanacetum coccineum]
MAVNLTSGAISKISTGECTQNDLKPVLQVTFTDRQGVELSDGSCSHFGCIADEIFISNKLQKGSIVQLTKFHFTKYYGNI